jgi:glucose/arabinose dehydrogenase
MSLVSCSSSARLPDGADIGPHPILPLARREWIPIIKIAPAVGWQPGATPHAAQGLLIITFATYLDHPRWLLALPSGDVLAVETNAPKRPDDAVGLRGWFMGVAMRRAGATTPSANRITLLRDEDADGIAEHRIFAAGLRNPNGMAWSPGASRLWVVVNERDEIGNDLLPDFLTRVEDGGCYGWPYRYFGPHVDIPVEPGRPDPVSRAITPDNALGAHTTSLGLELDTIGALGEPCVNGMFVGQHGPWNRRPLSGYKVIFIPFIDGHPSGKPIEVLTGFLGHTDQARGRPVGVEIGRTWALLVADDAGNTVSRVTALPQVAVLTIRF